MSTQGDSDRQAAGTDDGRSASGTIANGAIGALAGVVLFFLPFSTVLGGAVAGYLEGGSPRRGALVGTITGVITVLPLLLVARLVVWFAGFLELPTLPVSVLAGLVVAFVLVYVLALSVVGGVLGVVLRSTLDA